MLTCFITVSALLSLVSQSRVMLTPWLRDHVTYLAVHSALGRVMRQSVLVAASRRTSVLSVVVLLAR